MGMPPRRGVPSRARHRVYTCRWDAIGRVRRCALLFLLGGCASLLTVKIDGSATTLVEKGTLVEVLVGDLGFEELVQMDLTDEGELANQGVEPGDLVSVELIEFELEALSGSPDLDFIDWMEVSIEAPDLPEVVIASQSDFPSGEASVAMDLSGTELVDYAVSQAITLRTDVEARRPDQDTEVEARYVFRVQATLRGARNAAKNR